jgi:hypothetical protein
MDNYCKVYELNEYAPPEIIALREKIFNDPEVKEVIKAIRKEKTKKTK